MNVRVYLAGYMTGKGREYRHNWRGELIKHVIQGRTRKSLEDDEYVIPEFQWLIPAVPAGAVAGEGDPALYCTRDLLQIQNCQIMVANFDMPEDGKNGKHLGTAAETGLAYAWQKRLIVIDQGGHANFSAHLADSSWSTVEEAANALLFAAEGLV
jgi:hypothetical protein